MTTAQMLIKCLENEGVEYIFGIPGEENLDVMNAVRDSKIRFITTRHEQGAAFMADVYGRLTRKAGVCLSTLGPGATNLMTGVADANSDGAPLIAITGQAGTDRMHLTTHQFLDLVRMFEPITKRSKQIVRPDTVSEIVRIAFKYAESEKPGACHIDLPCNIAKMEITDPTALKPLKKPEKNIEIAPAGMIEKAASLIGRAKKPVILAGHSAIRDNAGKALAKFVTQLKIPLVHTMMTKGIIPYDNPYSLWTVGIPQRDFQNKILEDADLVIAVGYDIVEYAPAKWNAQGERKIIHIDTRAAHVNKLYQTEIEVIGNISESLKQIARHCSRTEEPEEALAVKKAMVQEHRLYEDDMSYPLKPQKILNDVRKVLGPEDILISDVGAHKVWIARYYHCYQPNTCIISNGFATMGIAVPGAVAAKIVYPERKILAVTGDGGFMMNSQELETAFRIGTPIVVLILSDGSYGLIKWKQQSYFGNSCFVDFSNPDFVKYAESMHARGYRVGRAQDLVPILQDAFSQKVPCVIDCPVDYAENMKLSRHLKEIWTGLENSAY